MRIHLTLGFAILLCACVPQSRPREMTPQECKAFQDSVTAGRPSGGPVDVDLIPPQTTSGAWPAFPQDVGVPSAGHAAIQFVIDTSGRVDFSSVQTVEATHPAFADAVRFVLGHWEFRPAQLAPGCPVKFMMVTRFDFESGKVRQRY